MADGNTPEPVDPPTQAQIIAALEAAVQAHLDGTAKAKGYDDIKSAALRAAYPGPFHGEGEAFATWMDACWAACYAVESDVAAGKRPIPTADALIAELPALSLA